MGQSVCRYTKISRETFSKYAERAKPCVFGVLTSLLEEYKNDDDDPTGFLDEEAEYVSIYEELKDRLGALGEPRGSGDSISGEENQENPGDISMGDLEYMEFPEESINNDTMQETEDEFSDHLMEELDDITMPELGMTDLDDMELSDIGSNLPRSRDQSRSQRAACGEYVDDGWGRYDVTSNWKSRSSREQRQRA